MTTIPSLRSVALTAALTLCIALPHVSSAQSSSCDPAFRQRVNAERQKAAENSALDASRAYSPLTNQPSFLSRSGGVLAGCANKGNDFVSSKVQSLLSASKLAPGMKTNVSDTAILLQREAVSRICDEARQRIPQELQQSPQKTALNALRGLPGYRNIPDPLANLAESSISGAPPSLYDMGGPSYSSLPGVNPAPRVPSPTPVTPRPSTGSGGQPGIPGITPPVRP